ncbi:hypothetical protein Oter_0037 [Opitutus terrae PB90-1]|uniref:DUF2934 domain-containing protein n=2 Tax=Opitutus terrae TaxID=107709 RepID=B1ZWK4_OPITP|nr:hypothetical protein Oter_0037 [Opitutus terrae PB90-1]
MDSAEPRRYSQRVMNDASSSSLSATSQSQISHDEISRHAQELWEKYGRPSGRDEAIWLEAERNLRDQRATTPAPAFAGEATPASTAPATPPPSPGARAGRAGGATATPRMPGGRARSKG